MKHTIVESITETARVVSFFVTLIVLLYVVMGIGLVAICTIWACVINPIVTIWIIYFGILFAIPSIRKKIQYKYHQWLEWSYFDDIF